MSHIGFYVRENSEMMRILLSAKFFILHRTHEDLHSCMFTNAFHRMVILNLYPFRTTAVRRTLGPDISNLRFESYDKCTMGWDAYFVMNGCNKGTCNTSISQNNQLFCGDCDTMETSYLGRCEDYLLYTQFVEIPESLRLAPCLHILETRKVTPLSCSIENSILKLVGPLFLSDFLDKYYQKYK